MFGMGHCALGAPDAEVALIDELVLFESLRPRTLRTQKFIDPEQREPVAGCY
jgi:hypothetical protein